METKSTTDSQIGNERWEEILSIVTDNVSHHWETLIQTLGVPQTVTRRLHVQYDRDADRCWHGLALWRDMPHTVSMSHELVSALLRCKQRRLADIVNMISSSHDDVTAILAPHLDREVRMCEAFYEVADGVHNQWRHLAKKLGLSPNDIAEIESREQGRSREKCMQVFYRWRLLVSLREYKVGSLIQALNACKLTEMAVRLKPFASSADVPPPVRRKRKGEVILHIETDLIEQLVRSGTTRGSTSQSTEVQKQYALNMIFIRLQDRLDLQDSLGTHPLVAYFHDFGESSVTEISRRGRYIVIQCHSRDRVDEMYSVARSGEISEQVTETLVTDEILRELGLSRLTLSAEVYDLELMTVRSQGSETYRSLIGERPPSTDLATPSIASDA